MVQSIVSGIAVKPGESETAIPLWAPLNCIQLFETCS
jgi:hypothetical protein